MVAVDGETYELQKQTSHIGRSPSVEILLKAPISEHGLLKEVLKNMNLPTRVFYDCEFLEGIQEGATHPTIDLISIGFVDWQGNELYLLNKETNLKAAWEDEWIRENVLRVIFEEFSFQGGEFITELTPVNSIGKPFSLEEMTRIFRDFGSTREEMKEDILNYLPKNPELWGYYSDYDHVALCWLFGKMIDLPSHIPMFTRDVRQLIIGREYLKSHPDLEDSGKAHSALNDARRIKDLYKIAISYA